MLSSSLGHERERVCSTILLSWPAIIEDRTSQSICLDPFVSGTNIFHTCGMQTRQTCRVHDIAERFVQWEAPLEAFHKAPNGSTNVTPRTRNSLLAFRARSCWCSWLWHYLQISWRADLFAGGRSSSPAFWEQWSRSR